jgi:hypothetical protein
MTPASKSAPAPLVAPSGVTVTPAVGGVALSWNLEADTKVTYTVTSDPVGLTCHVVDKTSCAFADTVSTPYSFSVVASKKHLATSPASATAPLNPRLVLVLAGQSNATGWQSYATDPITGIDYLAPPYTNGADANDLITWEPWAVLQGNGASPVALDSPQQLDDGTADTVFGPEIGLARQLWADTGRSVTIVKTAYEGSNLAANWSPSGTGIPPNGLFPAMVAEVKSVMATDAASGQFDVLGGFYWYQGESDAGNELAARTYQAHLKKFITALRKDLPMAATAPVVLAKEDCTANDSYLASTGAATPSEEAGLLTGNSEVRAADDWAAANMPDVVEVDTYGLARVDPSDIHLSNVSELTVGEEMATASEPHLP